MTRPTRVEINCETGEESIIELTDSEIAQMEADALAAEQARAALLIDSQTEWVWSGSLFAFAKMCNLRLDSHTQKEASEVAEIISSKAQELFPVSWKALLQVAK